MSNTPPTDAGPAAVANPDLALYTYHSGFQANGVEGPYPGVRDGPTPAESTR